MKKMLDRHVRDKVKFVMKNMESALYSHDFTNARATNIQILDDI
jgi:hypothetical protein